MSRLFAPKSHKSKPSTATTATTTSTSNSNSRPRTAATSTSNSNSRPQTAVTSTSNSNSRPRTSSRPGTSSRPRSASSSTGTSAPRDTWPPTSMMSMTTPWTTPSNSWPGVDLPPRDQCFQSAALFGKILEHIDYGSDRQSLRAQRQSLLWIALTSKALSPTATRYLWRRLDNLMPLLHLLPTFTKKNNKYGLIGGSHPYEWRSFDHHAAYVKEVVYEDIPDNIHIDPAVYLRLFLRNASILPNLERFTCKTTVRPSESEILVFLQSPLRLLELGTFEPGTLYGGDTGRMATTREAVVSSLSTNPSRISSLVLVDQPFSLLSEGLPLQNLTSLEFRAMYGVMDATLLRQIGSLPHLRSFTADSGCFTGLNLSNLERHPAMPQSTITLFLNLIASPRLRSLILGVRPARKVARAGAKDGNPPADLQSDPLFTIAQRWSRTLRRLHLTLDHDLGTLVNFLRHAPALKRLRLGGFLHVPPGTDLTAAFAGPSFLEVLAFTCQTGADPPQPIPLDIPAISRLVRLCPRLRELDCAFEAPVAPPPSATWPISQNLRVVRALRGSQPVVNTVALARYLDRLFPRLNGVRYAAAPGPEGPDAGSEVEAAAWAQVQELVFAFQDVRRGA
ncbi:hypothetical protein B0H14DRAFT_2633703 [Mycena olivaceomarginata]|nr:hypothetical protein B0H14DRAFT_2633703 [Mycena olivaceomarginata]